MKIISNLKMFFNLIFLFVLINSWTGNGNAQKVSYKKLECLADLLVLSPEHNVQTEIFAEKRFFGYYWPTFRRIVHEEEKMGEMKIWERELDEWLDKNEATKCLKENEHLLRGVKEKYFNVGELLAKSENGQLVVSDRRRQRIDLQMDCLANFLAKYVGQSSQYIVDEEYPKKPTRLDWHRHQGMTKDIFGYKNAILAKYTVNGHSTIKRWELKIEKNSEQMASSSSDNPRKITELIFHKKKDWKAFDELRNCYNLLSNKEREIPSDENGPFIDAGKMLVKFKSDQLFLRTLPEAEEFNFIYESHKKDSSKEEEEESCPYCLMEYENGEKLRKLPQCKHIFHDSCIDEWINKHKTCPICRSIDPLDPSIEAKEALAQQSNAPNNQNNENEPEIAMHYQMTFPGFH